MFASSPGSLWPPCPLYPQDMAPLPASARLLFAMEKYQVHRELLIPSTPTPLQLATLAPSQGLAATLPPPTSSALAGDSIRLFFFHYFYLFDVQSFCLET